MGSNHTQEYNLKAVRLYRVYTNSFFVESMWLMCGEVGGRRLEVGARAAGPVGPAPTQREAFLRVILPSKPDMAAIEPASSILIMFIASPIASTPSIPSTPSAPVPHQPLGPRTPPPGPTHARLSIRIITAVATNATLSCPHHQSTVR